MICVDIDVDTASERARVAYTAYYAALCSYPQGEWESLSDKEQWKWVVSSSAEGSAEMMFYTDYPITELGDTPGKLAPFRECSLISYDGDKYVDIMVDGVEKSIKRFYVYTKGVGCCGVTIPVTDSELETVNK